MGVLWAKSTVSGGVVVMGKAVISCPWNRNLNLSIGLTFGHPWHAYAKVNV
jgi:hypothetical protein